jgi:NADPH:quinone reductase-like Zn-dependent oxidoreductase
MKAIVYEKYGPPEGMRLAEVPTPIPTDEEILIKIRAVSVNRSDWENLTGRPFYGRLGGLTRPGKHILGSDIAGQVERVGSRNNRFKVGDEVFGDILSHLGGFAEYVCVRGTNLALKPAWLSFEQAAALPQAGGIALQGIRDKVRAGQSVLINGAGGGGGSFAIQLARLYGAEVTGVDNPEKLDFLKSLGAGHGLDYTHEDFTKNGKQYDLILDLVAYRSAFDYRRALKPNGSYYAVGGSFGTLMQILLLGSWIGRSAGKKIGILAVRPNPQDLLTLAELYRDGKLAPFIDKTYPLSQVPAAMQYLGEGHVKGKIVISVG